MDVEEVFVLCLIFAFMAFLIPFGMTEVLANSSLAGDVEPFILVTPYILIIIAVLIPIAYVVKNH